MTKNAKCMHNTRIHVQTVFFRDRACSGWNTVWFTRLEEAAVLCKRVLYRFGRSAMYSGTCVVQKNYAFGGESTRRAV